jgi:two-component system, cell cycle sensor histidine kinase and response regulator CckA
MNSIQGCSAQAEQAEAILVVDDDVQVLRFVARMLNSLGFRNVFQAASTEEAHDLWASYASDIGMVITDFVMPSQTGDLMALSMRKANSALKILFISGNDPLFLDSAIPLHPGLNFLQKPFTMADMRKSIECLTQCAA